ncbi:MAG: hypothetical protein ACTHMP_13500 [Thermomicrobiales bacterium]
MQVIRWLFVVIAVALYAGGVFLCWAGLEMGIFSPRRANRNADEAAQLLVVSTAADWRRVSVGQRVLVQGHLAANSPGRAFAREQGGGTATFVVYDLVRYDSKAGANGSTSIMEVREARVTPALTLQLADGAVQVVNGDYTFNPPYDGRGTGDGGRRAIGFTAGDDALVDGTVVQGPNGLALRATQLNRGPRDNYIGRLRPEPDSAGWAQFFGIVLGVLGVPCVLGGLTLGGTALWLWRRTATPRTAANAGA